MSLEIRHLSYAIAGQAILRDLTWQVPSGARYCLMAANGAGKTTLLNLLSGATRLPAPAFWRRQGDSGQIIWQGQDLSRMGVEARWQRGLRRSFQSHQLFPSLSLRQHLTLVAPTPADAADYLARFVQLASAEKIDQPVQALSYAQGAWLALALAVMSVPTLDGVANPPQAALLLADEPFAGVSGAYKVALVELFQLLPASATLIVVEHDLATARLVTQRAAILAQGRIVLDQSWTEILATPQSQAEAAQHYGGVRLLSEKLKL